MAYTFDPSFLAGFLRGEPEAVARAQELEIAGERRCVAAHVVFEILDGAMDRGERHVAKAFALLETLEVLPTDFQIASGAARITSQAWQNGVGVSSLDAHIAATASAHRLILLSRDQVFHQVHGLAVEQY